MRYGSPFTAETVEAKLLSVLLLVLKLNSIGTVSAFTLFFTRGAGALGLDVDFCVDLLCMGSLGLLAAGVLTDIVLAISLSSCLREGEPYEVRDSGSFDSCRKSMYSFVNCIVLAA